MRRGVAAPRLVQEELSADARFVLAITQRLRQQGFRGDPFLAVNEQHPEWTSERWTQALELKREEIRREQHRHGSYEQVGRRIDSSPPTRVGVTESV
jgi:hypothetical protein